VRNRRRLQLSVPAVIGIFLLPANHLGLLARLKTNDSSTATSKQANVQFISLSQASPVLQSLAAVLPEELVHTVAANDQAEWDRYVRKEDAATRKRLRAGDLDTLANLLLFGTSYTTATILTPELLKNIHAAGGESDASDVGSQALLLRLDQLTSGIAHPGTNERLRYFHDLLASEKYQFETSQDLLRVKQFLGANLIRMLHEDASSVRARRTAGVRGACIRRSRVPRAGPAGVGDEHVLDPISDLPKHRGKQNVTTDDASGKNQRRSLP